MINLQIEKVMSMRGITNPYAHLRKLGFSHDVARRIVPNKVSSLRLSHLSSICESLNCTPNDLFYYQNDQTVISESHELQKLKADRFDTTAFIKTLSLDKLMTLKQYAQQLKEKD